MTEETAYGRRNRIDIIDALRGLSILLMVIYHFHIDMYMLDIISADIMFHPVFNVLQLIFAGVFIILSGVSSRMSRNNLKRGVLMLLAACAVTAVTWFFDSELYVRFGILHFLGAASIIYAFAKKLIDYIPLPVQPFLWALFFGLSFLLTGQVYEVKFLWMFGMQYSSFISSDYFPLLPWIFIYLAGTTLGYYVIQNKMPKFIYTFKCRPLSFIGRNTIWVYLLHQPVCMGFAYLILYLHKSGVIK